MANNSETIYQNQQRMTGSRANERIVKADKADNPDAQVTRYLKSMGHTSLAGWIEALTASVNRIPTYNGVMRSGTAGGGGAQMGSFMATQEGISQTVQSYLEGMRSAKAIDVARARAAHERYVGGPIGRAGPGMGAGYKTASQSEIESMITAEAVKRGMDPNYAKRVFRGEGAGGYFGDKMGGRYTSFGPFQLHRGGPGSVGYEFERQTGLNLEDQSTVPQQIQFALNWANKHGWAAWHGRPGGRAGPTHVGVSGRQLPVSAHAGGWTGQAGGEPPTVVDTGGRTLFPRTASGELHHTEARMDPDLRARLLQMQAASPYGGARLMGPRSGYRSLQEQWDIWNARTGRSPVAYPGTSRHGRGQAADLSYRSAQERAWYQANAARYGIHFPVGGEPWHAQVIPGSRPLPGPRVGTTPTPAQVTAENAKLTGAPTEPAVSSDIARLHPAAKAKKSGEITPEERRKIDEENAKLTGAPTPEKK